MAKPPEPPPQRPPVPANATLPELRQERALFVEDLRKVRAAASGAELLNVDFVGQLVAILASNRRKMGRELLSRLGDPVDQSLGESGGAIDGGGARRSGCGVARD